MPGLDAETLADLARRFRHFAEFCEGQSPLYTRLSALVAEEPKIMALAAARSPRQPPVNLLFGAVHELLLAGVDHPLAGFYPSVGGRREASGADGPFTDFCREHAPRIVETVAARRVQTNEVGRCGLLLPAFALAWERLGRRPLSLIDVGSSAGLSLQFDRYRYEYTRRTSVGAASAPPQVCGPDSPARIRTALDGSDGCPLPREIPPVAARVGIDIAPVDVTDAAATRWIEALIWPDQLHRVELLRAAVSLARRDPPRVVAGDALDLVPGLVASAAPDVVPCVYHCHAIYQMDKAWRQRFADRLADLGRRRDLAHVSLEWLLDDPGPQLHLTLFSGGTARSIHLADCHHHGAEKVSGTFFSSGDPPDTPCARKRFLTPFPLRGEDVV